MALNARCLKGDCKQGNADVNVKQSSLSFGATDAGRSQYCLTTEVDTPVLALSLLALRVALGKLARLFAFHWL